MSLQGTVTRYDRKRGFGFISPSDGGEDLFVHWAVINSADKWPCLKKDMTVSYDTKASEKDGKTVADNVCDEAGGPISAGEGFDREISKQSWKGTVKMFAKKGFGFITSKSPIVFAGVKLAPGTDIYVSREDLECEEGSVCALRIGTKVSFKVCKFERDENGVAAAEVCNEDGSPLSVQAFEPGEHIFTKGKGKGKDKGKSKGKTTISSPPTKGWGKTGIDSSFSKGLAKGKAIGKGSATGKGHWAQVPVPVARTVMKPMFVKTPAAPAWGKGAAKGWAPSVGMKGKGKSKSTWW